MESTASTSHSAKVRIELRCQGLTLNVAQLCPGKLTLRNAVAVAPCHGQLHIFIDGHEDVQSIYLCEGITPGEKVVFI
jgi:hypothetical protein